METMVRRILRSIGGALIGVLSVLSVFPVTVAAATTVTDAYDQPTSLVLSTAANHTFTFTTASAVSEGSTMTFTFNAAFTVSTITEDDVDVADDGVDLTTAATCGGTENASVGISGQVLTVTICTGDGGAIASGSVVTVEIGTNATQSGSGTNRVTNPSSAGTYFISLGGAFGDSASFPLPIQTDDSSGVSAVVVSADPGGDDGCSDCDGGTGDTLTPGITVSSISGNTTEAGGTATFLVVLESRPSGDVSFGVSSSDTSEGTVSASSLLFTAADWDTAQTVTVTGVDDTIDDGDITYSIVTGIATSVDSGYSGLNPSDVSVINTDDETTPEETITPGITVSAISGSTTEAGGTATFTVVLDSAPSASVSLGLSSSDTGEGTASVSGIMFTSDNWNSPQTITVTGVDDAVDDGNITYAILTAAATSADGSYNGMNASDVSVVNIDDDLPVDDKEKEEETSTDTDTEDIPNDDGGTQTPDVTTDTYLLVDGGIILDPEDETFIVLSDNETLVVVDVTTTAAVTEVRVIIDGITYVLTPNGDGTYQAIVPMPSADSIIDVEADAIGAATARSAYKVSPHALGFVYEERDGATLGVPGAIVTVYHVVDGVRVPWDGAANPFVVGDTGTFAFYVPNGTYVVTAGKSGYEDGVSGEVTVTNHILAPSIVLTRIPVVSVPASDEETASGVFPPLVSVEGARTFLDSPFVQAAIDVAKPVVAVLALASIITLLTAFNLIRFLQYLVTAPLFFFAKRKRKAFGTVYNAATKIPVDLAMVRLYTSEGHRLVRSVITNAEGQFLLTVAPGLYVLTAGKQGLVFPSALLQGKKDDGTYLDVYTGQEIAVTDKNATIAVNVPLDPEGATSRLHTPRRIVLRRFLRVLEHCLALTGLVLAIVVLVLSPSVFTGVMCGVQIIITALSYRLSRAKKAKGWGIVYDAKTREPVGNAIVRLFEPVYNKLIETAVTDHLGRYAFLVGPNAYYATYSKPGYTEKVVGPIDYRAKAEPTALAINVPIEEHTTDV